MAFLGLEANVSSLEMAWLVPMVLGAGATVFRTVKHGIQIRDIRRRSHGGLCRELRAAIEGEYIIPAVADFVCTFAQSGRFLPLLRFDESDCKRDVSDHLQGGEYLDDLAQLYRYYEDLSDVDDRYEFSIDVARRRAVVAPAASLLSIAPVFRIVVGPVSWIPDSVVMTLGLLTVLLIFASVWLWYLEIAALNALAVLGDKYA